jgi:carbon starvation protein
VIGVVLLFICIWLGVRLPLNLSEGAWIWILLGYIFVASITPVWALLQPRDYLNSFLLYALLLGALIGILIQQPDVQLPAFTGLKSSLGFMFPVLFVTVACGAISGFHSLVSSGTTAKQLNNERDARVVGYGGMLTEGLLAVVALLAVSILTAGDHSARLAEAGPVALFSEGIGGFLSTLGITPVVGTSFAALAVSAFALTSLDTATRLGRYAFAELFVHSRDAGGTPPPAWTQNRYLGSAVVVAVSALLVFSGQWQTIWPIFGSANQLLAALSLLAVSVWLARRGRRTAFVRLPMYFMFAVTLTALLSFAYTNLMTGQYLLGILSVVLFVLAIVLALNAARALRTGSTPGPAPEAASGDSSGGSDLAHEAQE